MRDVDYLYLNCPKCGTKLRGAAGVQESHFSCASCGGKWTLRIDKTVPVDYSALVTEWLLELGVKVKGER